MSFGGVDISLNIIPALFIIFVTFGFQIIISDGAIVEESFGDPLGADFGGLDIIADIVNAIVGTLVLIFNLATFNIEGAPVWIRVTLGSLFTATITIFVIQTLRGN